MKSDVAQIYSNLQGREEALAFAERFMTYNRLTGKNAMHIRLLTEELISMVNGIMDDFCGDLWFESEQKPDGLHCRIYLSAKKAVDPKQEEQLLSVSTSGRNENARGILGKLRESFRVSAQYSGNGVYMNEYTTANAWYSMGMGSCELPDSAMREQCWSLNRYREQLDAEKQQMHEEWDELERSIIARIADDVKVWLKSDRTEVVVEKRIQ